MATSTAPAVAPQNDNQSTPEIFPTVSNPSSPSRLRPSTSNTTDPTRSRGQSNSSTFQGRLRSASKNFQESNPPTGMWIATGQIASSIPSLSDIRRGSFGTNGWSGAGQVVERERRASLTRRGSSLTGEDLPTTGKGRNSINPNSPEASRHQGVPETVEETDQQGLGATPSGNDTTATAKSDEKFKTTPFDNGYQFPPKHSWGEATGIFLKAAWKFVTTPIGFLVTIYGLNVVAWGGMLFLLLCNASKAMCKPTCNNINSPRRIWIEIDSQILNGLFCVTGFGTIPWRFRDLYYLLQYRVQKNELGLRRLAAINRGWFRLAGSQDFPVELGPANIDVGIASVPESSVPFPIIKIPNAPLTGIRAPPTPVWKLDYVIWAMVWNTFLQAVLSGFMWGFNRYKRPSWSTGLFVALACIVAACGGIMSFVEGKKVKSIEGVPVSERDQERLKRDNELGITHWNNINDEKPKEPKEKKEKKDHGTGVVKRKAQTSDEIQNAPQDDSIDDVVR